MTTVRQWWARSWSERFERAWLSASGGQHSRRPIYSVPARPVADAWANVRRAVIETRELFRMLYTSGQSTEKPRQSSTSAGVLEIKG